MERPRVLELTDLPACDPNVSTARCMSAGGTVLVVYEAKGPTWPDSESFAVVRFDRCRSYTAGAPNDEAFHQHPLRQVGAQYYALQEVVGARARVEVARIADEDGDPLRQIGGMRHFLFALKEDTFECFAARYSLVGTYGSLEAAIEAAAAIFRALT